MFYVPLDNIDDQNIGFMMTNNMQDKEIRDVRFDCFKSSNWPVVDHGNSDVWGMQFCFQNGF